MEMFVFIKLLCLHASYGILRHGGIQLNKSMCWAVNFHYGHNGMSIKLLFFLCCFPIYVAAFDSSHTNHLFAGFLPCVCRQNIFIKCLNQTFRQHNDNVIGYWSQWGNLPFACPLSRRPSAVNNPLVYFPTRTGALFTHHRRAHSILENVKNRIRQHMM